jgi:iron complex transport system permease protein
MQSALVPAAREKTVIWVLGLFLLGAILSSLMAGRFALSPSAIVRVLAARFRGTTEADNLVQADNVLFIIRLPRIFLAMLVGASLALSGAAYQSLFKNPLVSPDILGVSHGAGVGAALALLAGAPSIVVQGGAFGLGVLTVVFVLSLTRIFGNSRNTTVVLILTGTVMNAFFSSIISFIKYLADTTTKLPDIVFWLMGSFARSGNNRNVVVMFFVFLIGMTPLFLLRWKINVLSFGDEEARSMGVNVKRTRTVVILASTLVTATSVSLCGTIQWVGLIVPHISRLLVGPNNRALFPTAGLLGALFMLVVDDFARVIIPGELPVGAITAFVGAPLFLYMLLNGRGKKEWV